MWALRSDCQREGSRHGFWPRLLLEGASSSEVHADFPFGMANTRIGFSFIWMQPRAGVQILEMRFNRIKAVQRHAWTNGLLRPFRWTGGTGEWGLSRFDGGVGMNVQNVRTLLQRRYAQRAFTQLCSANFKDIKVNWTSVGVFLNGIVEGVWCGLAWADCSSEL